MGTRDTAAIYRYLLPVVCATDALSGKPNLTNQNGGGGGWKAWRLKVQRVATLPPCGRFMTSRAPLSPSHPSAPFRDLLPMATKGEQRRYLDR